MFSSKRKLVKDSIAEESRQGTVSLGFILAIRKANVYPQKQCVPMLISAGEIIQNTHKDSCC